MCRYLADLINDMGEELEGFIASLSVSSEMGQLLHCFPGISLMNIKRNTIHPSQRPEELRQSAVFDDYSGFLFGSHCYRISVFL